MKSNVKTQFELNLSKQPAEMQIMFQKQGERMAYEIKTHEAAFKLKIKSYTCTNKLTENQHNTRGSFTKEITSLESVKESLETEIKAPNIPLKVNSLYLKKT